ncbi:hypothetical protein MPSI1_001821 [Malassezia psittaci]|uniref:K Homology domain-containing protein n=1 Tax=Malassezia psittaci TaxID=1821823 RepID=A0AAF0JDZ7_9BASI|nr:hypothetical protein MPSI1_001821 [Malassezia psittaci]
MDLYLTTFALPKAAAGSIDAPDFQRTVEQSNSLSSSPEARIHSRSTGLAVSPPNAHSDTSKPFRNGAGRSSEAPLGLSASFSSLDGDTKHREDPWADIVQDITQKAMNANHCLVNAMPMQSTKRDRSGNNDANNTSRNTLNASDANSALSTSPRYPVSNSSMLQEHEPSTRSTYSGDLAPPSHFKSPVCCSPNYSFYICGTQEQALNAKGMLLRELPFAWQLGMQMASADFLDPSTSQLRTEVITKLTEIQRCTETKIQVGPARQATRETGINLSLGGSVPVEIVGTLEAIELARIRVLLIGDELHGSHIESLEIDRKLLHTSCGRKRALLQLIEEETHTSVYLSSPFAGVLSTAVPTEVASKRNLIYISGRFPNTQRARDMILQLTASRAKSLIHKSVSLMPRKIDWLLQERLDAVRSLMLDNSTYLELPTIGSQQNSLTVCGTSRVDVERSIRTLMQLVSPYYTASVWLIPGSYDPLNLSGKPDTRALSPIISAVSAGSGAEVAFVENHVELAGLDAEVREALRQLSRNPTLKPYSYEVRFQLELATDHREFISGKKNGKINKIMEQCGVRIRFEPFNDYDFLIDVSGSDMDAALQGLGLLQEELPAEMSFHVPEAYHKRIIGVGGKNIQRIMKKYGVYVKFSNAEEFATLGGYADNDDNVIARTPSKNAANLENLRNSVMELVSPKDKDFTTETVAMPCKYQRLLLGDKAHVLHEIERKTRCFVRFARRESASETIQIFGPETQIALAIQMVMQHVPLETEARLPQSEELSAMLSSREFTSLQDRFNKELGLTLQPEPLSMKDAREVILRITSPHANLEALPRAKLLLDELCSSFHVLSSPNTLSLPGAHHPAPNRTSGSPFSSSLPSSTSIGFTADSNSDSFSQDPAGVQAASVASAGTQLDDTSSEAEPKTSSKNLKALFEQPDTSDALASNTPLMPSFYTPGYSDSAGFSHSVWGLPFSSMPDRNSPKPPLVGNNHSGNNSVFSPFTSSAMPFPFAASDGNLGSTDTHNYNAAFRPPIRRPDGMGGGMPSHVTPGYPAGGPPSHGLGRLPLGMHSNGRMSDIDGFHPLTDTASHMPIMQPSNAVPSHRHANMGGVRANAPPQSSPSDTMDEVSRVLAQLAFDKP